jgi:hypothetical protein
MGYAVSANPTAATLEKLFVGQRSGVSPVRESLRSQNQRKVRCSSVSRNAACLSVSCGEPGSVGPVTVEFGVVAHADRRKASGIAACLKTERTVFMRIFFPAEGEIEIIPLLERSESHSAKFGAGYNLL